MSKSRQDKNVCVGCTSLIDFTKDFNLIDGKPYHIECTKCLLCQSDGESMYYTDGESLFCHADYFAYKSPNCAICSNRINASDIIGTCVDVANEKLYFHKQCLTCTECEFFSLDKVDGVFIIRPKSIGLFPSLSILCRQHFCSIYAKTLNEAESYTNASNRLLAAENFTTSQIKDCDLSSRRRYSSCNTRNRTLIGKEQLELLKNAYAKCSNPDKMQRNLLVALTNLPAKTVRVWFQNHRNKMKKMKEYDDIQVDRSSDETYKHATKEYALKFCRNVRTRSASIPFRNTKINLKYFDKAQSD